MLSENKPKMRAVCRRCGSDDVHADAYSSWDVAQQEWVLGGEYDDEWCSNCEAEGHNVIEMKEVPSDE